MPRPSNIFLGIFNAITLLAGLLAIACGLYFLIAGNSACQKGIQNPILIVGAVFFVISLLGLVGSWCRSNVSLVLYLVVMFALIVGLLALTVFGILVTNQNVSKGASIMFRGSDLPNWVRYHFVEGEKNWYGIKNCLVTTHLCSGIGVVGNKDVSRKILAEFYKKHWSPTQVGCCQPPASCGFVSQNATVWLPPKGGAGAAAGENKDCKEWSNQQQTLCFNCDSCKVGFTNSIKKKWRVFAIVNFCFAIACIILYSLACCARKNNKRDNKHYPH